MSDLKPANENPWYVLMTLYGEYGDPEYDPEENRKAWNAWTGKHLNGDDEEAIAEATELNEREFRMWTHREKEIRARHQRVWEKRNPTRDYLGFPKAGDLIDLKKTEFKKEFNADKFVFHSKLEFEGSKFEAAVRFEGSIFRRYVNFRDVIFAGGSSFNNSVFSSVLRLSKANVCGIASFKGVHFEAESYFSGTVFSGPIVMFHACRLDGPSHFNEACFGVIEDGKQCVIQIRDCHFFRPTSFRDARFLTHAPDFEGAVLHDKTTFTAEDKDAEGPFWPVIRSNSPIEPLFWKLRSSQSPKQARDCYAAIRHTVAKQGLPEDEHFFFRREMFYAGRYGPRFPRLLYKAFGLLSDYGHSVGRPLTAILAVIGGWAYLLRGVDPSRCPEPLVLSASNTFPFFGFLRTYYPKCGQALAETGSLAELAGIQTALSFILLFFLGLGLRQRFRLR